MPNWIHTFAALRRLALLGWLVWASLAAAAQETPPEVPLQAWQYQAVYDAMHDPVRATRKAALVWLAENARPDQPGNVPDKLLRDVAALLRDPSWQIKQAAAEALGNMGAAGAAHAKDVAALLRDPNTPLETKHLAAEALGRMGGPVAAAHAKDVIALLRDPDPVTQQAAAEVLDKMGNSLWTSKNWSTRVLCLEAALPRSDPDIRLLCYLLGPLTPEEQTLLNWLGDREGNDFPQHKASDIDAVRTKLEHFASVWPQLGSLRYTQKAVAEQVHQFVHAHAAAFTLGDVPALTLWTKRLNDAAHTAEAAGVEAAMSRIAFYDKLRLSVPLVFGHAGLWVLLIWAYPRWPLVQSLFIWNPWARRFVGLGYVGWLITVVPTLRRRLFQPFRDSLVQRGSLAPFDADTYFPASDVSPKSSRNKGARIGLAEALPEIRGQIVLEGESGLGKTSALLKLARQSGRIAVLLRATECSKGPVAAIQARLQGVVKDEAYLRSLIHAGAIDVLIDGLNEATPNTRAAIVHFVEESFRGNFILTTQPMDWEPPRTAEVLVLHPLRRDQIADFLDRQWPAVRGQSVYPDEKAYKKAVGAYMDSVLSWGEDDARLRVLSNPMEASLVAELIAQGEQPDLLGLLEQRFRAMETEFRAEQNRDFPYVSFAEQVYAWRRSGAPYFPFGWLRGRSARLGEAQADDRAGDGSEDGGKRKDPPPLVVPSRQIHGVLFAACLSG